MSNLAPSKEELRFAEFMAEQELLSYVRQACDESGLDRQEIARRLGIHKSNVSKILNSPRNLTVRMAARLVRAAGRRLFFSCSPIAAKGQTRGEALQNIDIKIVVMEDYKPYISSNTPDKITPSRTENNSTLVCHLENVAL